MQIKKHTGFEVAKILSKGLDRLVEFCEKYDRILETFTLNGQFAVWVVSDQEFDDDQECVDLLIEDMKEIGWVEEDDFSLMFSFKTTVLNTR